MLVGVYSERVKLSLKNRETPKGFCAAPPSWLPTPVCRRHSGATECYWYRSAAAPVPRRRIIVGNGLPPPPRCAAEVLSSPVCHRRRAVSPKYYCNRPAAAIPCCAAVFLVVRPAAATPCRAAVVLISWSGAAAPCRAAEVLLLPTVCRRCSVTRRRLCYYHRSAVASVPRQLFSRSCRRAVAVAVVWSTAARRALLIIQVLPLLPPLNFICNPCCLATLVGRNTPTSTVCLQFDRKMCAHICLSANNKYIGRRRS